MKVEPFIRHVSSVLAGTWGEEPDESASTVRCLRVADFDYSQLTNKDVTTRRNISLSDIQTKLLKNGDIIIEKSGGGEKTPVGRAIIVNNVYEPTTYANFTERIRLKSSLNSDYANYVLSHMYSQGINTKYIKQNTGIQNLEVKAYLRELILIPKIENQLYVVKFLDKKTATIDKMIAAKNRTRTHLAELRTAIISELIFGAKGLEDGSNQLYRHLISQQSGTWGLEPNGFNEVKCLRVADFDYDKLTHVEPETIRSIDSNHMATKLLRHGDILIEKSGGGEKTPVGRAIIVNELNGLTSYANFIDRLRFKKTVLPRYALYVLYAMYSGGINTKHIKQNTGIQNLDIKHYLKETVPIPSIQDQLSIIKHAQVRLSKLDAAADLLNKTILQLKEYRTSLISNVITGKVEV